MRCVDRLCNCLLQDGETLEYMLAWIQEEPLKGGILFVVSPCSPALKEQCHTSCAEMPHDVPSRHISRRWLQTWLAAD